MIAHNVYFNLKDNSAAAVKAMVEDCHRCLASLPGIVFYAAGTPTDKEDEFDVALHVVFKDRAALEAYMDAPRHVELIGKHHSNWKNVRAFDSCVDQA
jgi:hypothetical protein